MSFITRYPGQVVIAEGTNDLAFGTVMLGDTYGEIQSASVERGGEVQEIKSRQQLIAILISNLAFKLKLKALFKATANPPDIADQIEFPFAGITGRVLPPITVEWEENGHRMLSIEATSWDAFGDTNEGAGNAYTFDGETYTPKS